MAGGRPTKIVNRRNTSISLSDEDMQYIKRSGKETSVLFRELLAEKRKSEESPVGKIKQEIAEKKKHVEEELLLIQLLETRLKEEEEKAERKLQEKAAEDENMTKLKEFIIKRFNFIVGHKSPKDFLDYLCKTYNLKDNQEAKKCIFETLLEAGHPADRLRKIPMLKGV